MDGASPKISVVIPNRNGVTPRDGLTFLEIVLPSVRAQTSQDFDITVVDNGSTDGSVGYLRRNWPEVRIVELGENLGFPAAINRGIGATSGEYVALLNSDVELTEDWLERLGDELDRDPGVGFATSKILLYLSRGVIEQAGQDLYTCGRFAPRGMDEEDVGQFAERGPTTIATGAASVYRRSALEAAGGFDEDYFLYCEDADLCLRMLLLGYRGLYVPDPVAYHVRGGTIGPDSEVSRFYLQRNTLITLGKDMPAPLLLRHLPKILLYVAHQYQLARKMGAVRTLLRAHASFLGALPGTIRKRRQLQKRRRISPSDFEGLLLTDYPLPTRLAWLVR